MEDFSLFLRGICDFQIKDRNTVYPIVQKSTKVNFLLKITSLNVMSAA